MSVTHPAVFHTQCVCVCVRVRVCACLCVCVRVDCADRPSVCCSPLVLFFLFEARLLPAISVCVSARLLLCVCGDCSVNTVSALCVLSLSLPVTFQHQH